MYMSCIYVVPDSVYPSLYTVERGSSCHTLHNASSSERTTSPVLLFAPRLLFELRVVCSKRGLMGMAATLALPHEDSVGQNADVPSLLVVAALPEVVNLVSGD